MLEPIDLLKEDLTKENLLHVCRKIEYNTFISHNTTLTLTPKKDTILLTLDTDTSFITNRAHVLLQYLDSRFGYEWLVEGHELQVLVHSSKVMEVLGEA